MRETSNGKCPASDALGAAHSASSREGRVLWLLTIVQALVGQQVLSAPDDGNLGLGVFLLGVAAVGLLVLMRRAESPLPPPPPLFIEKRGEGGEWGEGWPHPVAWLIAGLALVETALTLLLIHDRPPETPCWDALALWAVAILLTWMAGLAAETHWPAWAGLRAWAREHRGEIALVAGLTAVGLALRTVALESIPANLGGDEASQGLEAIRFIDGRLGNMFVTGWLGVPTMSFLLQAVTIKACGPTVFGLRILWAIVGAATLPTLYVLGRQLFDRRMALVATAFLAAYHFHVHYSRLGSNQVADGLFLTAALAALVWGLRRNSTFAFALSGVIAGLGMYFYAGARLTPVALVAVLAVVGVINGRRWRVPWAGLALLGLGFLAAAAPMLLLAAQHPDEFNARLSAVGLIQSGWLTREVEITGKSLETILGEQFLKAALGFHHYWDRTTWYGLRGPLLDLIPGALAALGFVYALTHWRERRYAIPALWAGLVIGFGAFLTENPLSSQRLVGAAPALAILAAVGLVHLTDLARELWGGRPARWNIALALVVCLMVAWSVNLYFLDFSPQRIYGNPNSEVATELGYWLRDHPAHRVVYFFAPPRMYYGFATIPYLAPGAPGLDVREPLHGPPDFVVPGWDALFVFLPERLAEREWVERSYPGGAWQMVPDHRGQLLFALYEVQIAE